MNVKKYLKISWPILYVGLRNDWLTVKEVVAIINQHVEELDCNEQILVDINVNEDDRSSILEILEKQGKSREIDGIRGWHLAHLLAIAHSDISVHEKLRELELQWSRFDYPETWREFIYYMPNDNSSTEDELYERFMEFLIEEEQSLSWDGNGPDLQP